MRLHHAAIRVFDEASKAIETHEHEARTLSQQDLFRSWINEYEAIPYTALLPVALITSAFGSGVRQTARG
jgi:hypothetical protein